MDIIANNNCKTLVSDEIYKNFNNFIFSNDIKIIGKLLHRYEYFNKIKHLPGDLVEIGVFKGSGIATFSKFLELYCPNSNKKVIGFDIFNPSEFNKNLNDSQLEQDCMNTVYSRVKEDELSLKCVENNLNKMCIHKKYLLVEGDVEYSIPSFLEKNPGLRISMLYIDCDLERPTYYSLKYLWDRILPGGIILFDEYEYHGLSESNGVDKFLKENNIEYNLISTNFMCPTAYIVKR
jgi:hypothetical protein